MIFTILIADDDMSERQLMQAFLASLGYRVVGGGGGGGGSGVGSG
jgi:CheY-like chemotaxis protein